MKHEVGVWYTLLHYSKIKLYSKILKIYVSVISEERTRAIEEDALQYKCYSQQMLYVSQTPAKATLSCSRGNLICWCLLTYWVGFEHVQGHRCMQAVSIYQRQPEREKQITQPAVYHRGPVPGIVWINFTRTCWVRKQFTDDVPPLYISGRAVGQACLMG